MTETIPLVAEEGGLRIRSTRIRLEHVLDLYDEGRSPEEIALAYSLPLDAVYAVLLWALRHPEEVAAYRAEVEERAREAKARAQAYQPQALLARLARLARLRQGG